MKKALLICLAIALLLSFAACTAAPVEETPAPTPEAISEPTPSPTPESTPTPEMFTEEEKEYLEYIEWLGFYDSGESSEYSALTRADLYAILFLEDAYNKGKLVTIIQETKLTNMDLNTLLEMATYLKGFYNINYDLFSEVEQEGIDYSGVEGLLKIFRGDTDKLSFRTLGNIQSNLQNTILNDVYPFLANPKESRGNIKELISLFDEAVETKNVDKFDEKMNSSDYSILEKWQVIEYCLLHGSNDIEWQPPTITYKGEQMIFVLYAINSRLVEKIHNELEDYLVTNYLRDEDKGQILEIR